MMQLNEEYTTTLGKSVFFIGMTSDDFDVKSQVLKKDYKVFDRISLESSIFATSTYEYALNYAQTYQNGTKKGVMLAFQLPPNTKFFDLRDPNDYISLGLDPSIARIFMQCEPYFAINLNIPKHQRNLEPVEFKIAKAVQRFGSPKNKSCHGMKAILNGTVEKFPDSKEYESIYVSNMKYSLAKLFGKDFETAIPDISSKVLSKEHIDQLVEAVCKEKNYKRDYFDAKRYCKIGCIDAYPPSISNGSNSTMFENYKKLYNPDTHEFKPIDRNNITLVDSYLSLFREVRKFYFANENTNSLFMNGVNKIKERLSAASKNGGDSTHIYIDLLQYVFFSLLTSGNQYVGVTCPEFKGYVALSNGKRTYAMRKNVNCHTIASFDRTIILCKSIADVVQMNGKLMMFGHYSDDIVENVNEDLMIDLIRDQVPKLQSVDHYKRFYEHLMHQFVNSPARIHRKKDAYDTKRRELNDVFNQNPIGGTQFKISGTVYKVDGKRFTHEQHLNNRLLQFKKHMSWNMFLDKLQEIADKNNIALSITKVICDNEDMRIQNTSFGKIFITPDSYKK